MFGWVQMVVSISVVGPHDHVSGSPPLPSIVLAWETIKIPNSKFGFS